MKRRRRAFPHSFEDQMAAEKSRLEEQAATLPPGPQKDALLDKIRQLEAAARMNEWLTIPRIAALDLNRT
jgi:hypothetical protein